MSFLDDKIIIHDIVKETQNKISVYNLDQIKVSIKDFLSDFDLTFNYILLDNSSAQVSLNSFKNKYNSFILNHYVNISEREFNEYQLNIVKLIFEKYLNFRDNCKEAFFLSCCLNILEIFWNCYLVNIFSQNCSDSLTLLDNLFKSLLSNNTDSYSSLNHLKDLFIILGNDELTTNFIYFKSSNSKLPDCRHNINRFLDELIIRMLENNENKEFSISLNILFYSKNKSTFLSLKIILLYLQSIIKLNYDINFIESITMNIALLLKEEVRLLSCKISHEKLNNHDNTLNDRKLVTNETNFLKDTLFEFIILILEIVKYNDNSFKDKIFFNLNSYFINYELNNQLEVYINEKKTKMTNKHINLYHKSYIFLHFIVDIIDLIYSNFLYTNEIFEYSEKFSLNIDQIQTINQNKIIIKDFQHFLSIVVFRFIYDLSSNYLEIIYIFNKINEFKSKNQEKLHKNEEMPYAIYEPLNAIGFSILSWMVFKYHFFSNDKKYNFIPLITESSYLLDCYLPLIATLIKRGELFIFMGIEMLFYILSFIREASVKEPKKFRYYCYESLLLDVIRVAGGQLSNKKKETLTKEIIKYFTILQYEARNNLFIFAMNNSNEDGQIAFIIYILKNYMSDQITFNDRNSIYLIKNPIFSEKFVKDILEINFNLEHCVIDTIENLTQALNFFHFIIIQDKCIFDNYLGLFNRKFLENFQKNKLMPIFKIIEAWILGLENEKNKFLDKNESLMDTNEFNLHQKKIQKNFEIKRNKGLLTLNMIRIVENLIHNILKKI